MKIESSTRLPPAAGAGGEATTSREEEDPPFFSSLGPERGPFDSPGMLFLRSPLPRPQGFLSLLPSGCCEGRERAVEGEGEGGGEGSVEGGEAVEEVEVEGGEEGVGGEARPQPASESRRFGLEEVKEEEEDDGEEEVAAEEGSF